MVKLWLNLSAQYSAEHSRGCTGFSLALPHSPLWRQVLNFPERVEHRGAGQSSARQFGKGAAAPGGAGGSVLMPDRGFTAPLLREADRGCV